MLTPTKKGAGLFAVLEDRRARQGDVTDMRGRNSCDGAELKKPHIYSGLPAINKLCLHTQHTTALKLD